MRNVYTSPCLERMSASAAAGALFLQTWLCHRQPLRSGISCAWPEPEGDESPGLAGPPFILSRVDGSRRPGLRRLLVSYFFAASLRCQASSVAGVTGKTSAQRLRGISRARAVNLARSAGSYRTRPTCRRSTAFSCRSTSSSAPFARSPRKTRTARPSTRHVSR
jgi:hypothetical protein